MTKDEFRILAKSIKAEYRDMFQDQQQTIIWYQGLKDLTYNKASAALMAHMMTDKYHKITMADIRSKALATQELPALEAWAIVRKAIRNSGYNFEEEFEKLPPTVKRAVGKPLTLYTWSQNPTDMIGTTEAHFIKAYNAALEQKKHESMLPLDVAAALMRSEQAYLPEKED